MQMSTTPAPRRRRERPRRRFLGTLGAFVAAIGGSLALMRWLPAEPAPRLMLGAAALVPLYILLTTLILHVRQTGWAGSTCAVLLAAGVLAVVVPR